MTTPFMSWTGKRVLFCLGLCAIVASAGLAAMAEIGWFRLGSPVGAGRFVGPSAGVPKTQPSVAVPLTDERRRNWTYPDAPAPGSAYFGTPTFAELTDKDRSTPGTRAARDLLLRSHKGNAADAEAQYDGSAKKGFDEYKRAVFLNTVAVIHERDARLLKNTTFVRFYDGKKQHALEYGIILSGLTPDELARANMRPAGFLGTTGRRSPKEDAVASLEASWEPDGDKTFAFDVDLYNPKAEPVKHTAEVEFNDNTPAATHPADVARALQLRGILSGVTTR